MLRRNWFKYAEAFRGIGLVACTLGAGFIFISTFSNVFNEEKHGSIENNARNNYKKTKTVPQLRDSIEGDKPSAVNYPHDCKNPENHDAADYCVQLRVAKAAEDALVLTQTQTNIGIWGLVGVIASLILSAISAIISAKSAGITKSVARSQLRAYIGLDEAIIFGVEAGLRARAVVRLKNAGSTPAIRLEMSCTIGLYNFPLVREIEEPPAPHAHSRSTILPGHSTQSSTKLAISLLPEYVAMVNSGTAAIYVVVRARYYDIFGDEHRSTIRLMYGGDHSPDGNSMTICPEGHEDT